jgi:hypothetical protein
MELSQKPLIVQGIPIKPHYFWCGFSQRFNHCKVYDHLEQAGEINITPVKVEFETEQLKRKGTLQNTEYIELNPKARDFVMKLMTGCHFSQICSPY